jgi:hypothetical protein
MSNALKYKTEKRGHERTYAKLPAQIRIWIPGQDAGKITRGTQHIVVMAETNNISIGGMSLKIVGASMDADKSLTRSNASRIIGRPAEIVIDNKKIVVWGDVIRADANSLEIAVAIYKVSDVKLWKKVCAEQAGISIFPNSPRVNRKRRS